MNLKERMDNYESINNNKLMIKTPFAIVINGTNFNKMTSEIEKPFDQKLSEVFANTMLQLANQIDGCVFGYHYNDEVILIVNNKDTNTWCDNKVQKMSSLSASIFTMIFNQKYKLLQPATFYAKVFSLPDSVEAANYIISKQIAMMYLSLQFACIYYLQESTSSLDDFKTLLSNLSREEKINLLKKKAGIDYYAFDNEFIKGVACYKVPTNNRGRIKNKWLLNNNLPIFSYDVNYISSIIKNGADIIREENIKL